MVNVQTPTMSSTTSILFILVSYSSASFGSNRPISTSSLAMFLARALLPLRVQNLLLPRRNIDGRFTSINGHSVGETTCAADVVLLRRLHHGLWPPVVCPSSPALRCCHVGRR